MIELYFPGLCGSATECTAAPDTCGSAPLLAAWARVSCSPGLVWASHGGQGQRRATRRPALRKQGTHRSPPSLLQLLMIKERLYFSVIGFGHHMEVEVGTTGRCCLECCIWVQRKQDGKWESPRPGLDNGTPPTSRLDELAKEGWVETPGV